MLNRTPMSLALTLTLGLSTMASAQTFPSLENVPTPAQARAAAADKKAEPAPAAVPAETAAVEPAAAPVAEAELGPAAAPVAEAALDPAAAPVAGAALDPAAAPVAEASVEPAAAPVADPYSAEVRAAIGAPVDGKGKIVFFRPGRFQGAAVGFKVREGETELGKLRNGRYFVVEADPGTHQYTVHSEAKDVTTLEIEAGETYFVEGKVNMGFMVGRPNLTPSDVAAFEEHVAKLKPAAPLDDDDKAG